MIDLKNPRIYLTFSEEYRELATAVIYMFEQEAGFYMFVPEAIEDDPNLKLKNSAAMVTCHAAIVLTNDTKENNLQTDALKFFSIPFGPYVDKVFLVTAPGMNTIERIKNIIEIQPEQLEDLYGASTYILNKMVEFLNGEHNEA